MMDTDWITYGTDEYMQPKQFRVVNDRIQVNWNSNFDMSLPVFAEYCGRLNDIPLSHEDQESAVLMGAQENENIIMSKTFSSDDSKTEYVNFKIGEYRDTGKFGKFSKEELLNILNSIQQIQ